MKWIFFVNFFKGSVKSCKNSCSKFNLRYNFYKTMAIYVSITNLLFHKNHGYAITTMEFDRQIIFAI